MRLHTRLRYAPAEVNVEKRADGAMILRSPQPLKRYARAVGDWLLHWYDHAPDRTFIAERKGENWRRVSYRDALSDARRIGQALLNLGLNAERPVAILSDNSVDHALLALGAMHVGVPVAPTAASAGANFSGSAANTRPGLSSSKMYFSFAKSFDISE